jgi:manganese oxidase
MNCIVTYEIAFSEKRCIMNGLEKRIRFPDGIIAEYQTNPYGRYFKLRAEPIKHQILSEITIDGLGYNGTTPGPLLIVNQGEWVFIEVENHFDEPTSLHVHGLSKPNSQDGIPEIEPTPKIMPGMRYTYQFLAWQSGTFFYHSGNPLHISKGMMGGFIVLPQHEQNPPASDFVLILQQWELPQPKVGSISTGTFKPEKFDVNPNFFTINGKSFPNTTPLQTKVGQKNRIRFINKSNAAHSMHVHGHDFQLVEIDGFQRNEYMDTLNVPSGQRCAIEFPSNNPGIWPINGTKTFHQTNNGVTPGGMITRLKYL